MFDLTKLRTPLTGNLAEWSGRDGASYENLHALYPEMVSPDDRKLTLENINFYQAGPKLTRLNVDNCIFINCDFRFLTIDFPSRENAQFINCDFTGAVIKGDYTKTMTEGLPEPTKRNKQNNNLRLMHWEQLMSEQCPEFCPKIFRDFSYNNLNTLADVGGGVVHRDSFYFFNCDDSNSSLGWKLHLSVNHEQLSLAYELAIPLLVASNLQFKVANIEEGTGDRCRMYAQFTIYLSNQNPELVKPAEEIECLMREIAGLLQEHGVQESKLPESDAKLIFPYFSLRNDLVGFEKQGLIAYYQEHFKARREVQTEMLTDDDDYLPTNLAGNHYNPFNYHNPFLYLVSPEVPVPSWANSAGHFIKKLTQEEEARGSYITSMNIPFTAAMILQCYIQQHLFTTSLSNEDCRELLYNICQLNLPIPDRFFQNQDILPQTIQSLKTAILGLIYLIENDDITFLKSFIDSISPDKEFVSQLKILFDLHTDSIDNEGIDNKGIESFKQFKFKLLSHTIEKTIEVHEGTCPAVFNELVRKVYDAADAPIQDNFYLSALMENIQLILEKYHDKTFPDFETASTLFKLLCLRAKNGCPIAQLLILEWPHSQDAVREADIDNSEILALVSDYTLESKLNLAISMLENPLFEVIEEDRWKHLLNELLQECNTPENNILLVSSLDRLESLAEHGNPIATETVVQLFSGEHYVIFTANQDKEIYYILQLQRNKQINVCNNNYRLSARDRELLVKVAQYYAIHVELESLKAELPEGKSSPSLFGGSEKSAMENLIQQAQTSSYSEVNVKAKLGELEQLLASHPQQLAQLQKIKEHYSDKFSPSMTDKQLDELHERLNESLYPAKISAQP